VLFSHEQNINKYWINYWGWIVYLGCFFAAKAAPTGCLFVGVAGDRGTGNGCYLATNKTAANIELIIGVGWYI
jgi:hypothetical protein